MIETLFKVLIIFLGLGGFCLAFFIFIKKRGKKRLVCPLRSNCDRVIRSDYSRFLGIPIEVLGMLYYAFVFVMYLGMMDGFITADYSDLMLYTSGLAVVFSLYLVSIQAFVIKQWCVWCLTSAFISTLIFLISYITRFVI